MYGKIHNKASAYALKTMVQWCVENGGNFQ